MPSTASDHNAAPLRFWLLVVPLLASTHLLLACIDTTPPWRKVQAQGGAGGGGEPLGGAMVAIDGGLGGTIDVAAPGWDGTGGAGGGIDAPWAGAGGRIDAGRGGAGGVVADLPLPGTGGVATGGGGGGPDVPLGTDGSRIDGPTASGGVFASAGAGSGGRIGSGGRSGSGGAATGGAGGGAAIDGAPPAPDGGTVAGLVIHYACDQIAAATLPDSSGRAPANDGILGDSVGLDGGATTSGYAITTPGKVGSGALSLVAGSQGHVSMPPVAFAGAAEMTIATWVYVNSTQAGQRIFDIGSSVNSTANPSGETANVYMNLVPSIPGSGGSGRKLTFAITTAGAANEQKLAVANFSNTVWTHVALVLGGGIGTLYVNGSAAATDSISLSPASLGPVGYAYIGKSWFTSDPYFDGMIDDFRVYRRALSAGDVRGLYEGQQ